MLFRSVSSLSQSRKIEDSDGESFDSSGLMTTPQRNMIDIKAQQLDIDVMALFKDLNIKTDKIFKSGASKAIDALMDYQKDKDGIPSSLQGYKKDWSNN